MAMMKTRFGLVAGFGLGYYLGAKAGRERYIQINAMIRKARRSDAYHQATDKAEAVVDLAAERAKGFVEEHLPDNGKLGSKAST
jgi:hypothetical protein